MSPCFPPRPVYANPPLRGIDLAASIGDGDHIKLRWFRAYSPDPAYQVVNNIYYSTRYEDVFAEGVKYVVIDPLELKIIFGDFRPGDTFYFGVKSALHQISLNDINGLPLSIEGCRFYPEEPLVSTISATALVVPILDVTDFPPYGVLQIGAELMSYENKNAVDNTLLIGERGLYGTFPREHTPDGYDGYRFYDNPLVRFFIGWQDDNIGLDLSTSTFIYPHQIWTPSDGYAKVTQDLVTTPLGAVEVEEEGFKPFDYSGYRRTDFIKMLNGECVASYYGGDIYCDDGYGKCVRVRGLPINEFNSQREELLLSLTGEPVVLVRRMWTGIRCDCVGIDRETPEYRCPNCYGGGFVTSYNQYYNPRRSDRRIMMRFEPAVDDLIPIESGLELDYKPNSWTLIVPTLKERDFVIRFNVDGTEEFRYMIMNVTRNKILLNHYGAQKMALARIRKTDPIYQWNALPDAQNFPENLITSIGFVPGPEGIPPHTHRWVKSERMEDDCLNQTTSISQDHNHPIRGNEVVPVLGHTHRLIF